MHRVPYSVQGFFFGPALVCLFFILKNFCPASAGNMCFSDQFAVPIFMPLIAVYRIFGDSSAILHQEFLFTLIYWAVVGLLVGLIIDLAVKRDPYIPQSQYSPEQRRPL